MSVTSMRIRVALRLVGQWLESRPRHWHRCRTIGTISLSITFSATSVLAQEARTARAGQQIVIASSTQQITNTSGTLRGSVAILESPSTPKAYTLIYTAPATDSVFTETVKYTNPDEHSVVVTVTPAGNDSIYSEAFKALFILFVVAVLLESGLAIIFNWRPFLVYFDGRGVRTLVAVAFAYMFVQLFNMDLVTRLVNIYSQPTPPFETSFIGKFITALVMAGGSSAVNNLFIALGFRPVRTAEQVAPRPARTEGWVSVSLTRDKAVGPVFVSIGDPQAGDLPVAGTIVGRTKRTGLARLFLRDPARFPMSAGYSVPVNVKCEIRLEGMDSAGNKVTKSWAPRPIAPGAIVDIDLTL